MKTPATKTWVGTILLTALLSSRVSVAETVGVAKPPAPPTSATVGSSLRSDLGSALPAPIGHRQPRTVDVPSENPGALDRLDNEDLVVDRKLNICHGC
jgi:hypothetical protein